jgi:uncharacterized protein YjbI with pentapeptide repeats
MIDHKKIEEAIDNYFNNTPTAKIIENLDRHAIDRKKDLDRENANDTPINNNRSISDKLVRFEEVSLTNQDAAALAVSIEDLGQSQRLLESLNKRSRTLRKFLQKKNLIQDIVARQIPSRELKGVNLRGANLSGANLLGANLNGANLDGCNLSISRLSIANLRGANLRGANLSGADLFGADLSGADLSIANLRDVNLNGADLSGADLGGANLSGANLSRTKLHGAKLSGVDVKNTRFESSSGISESMKQNLIDKGAIFDGNLGDRSESKNLVPR